MAAGGLLRTALPLALLGLAACQSTLVGSVRGTDGAPVKGATLHAPGPIGERDCDAVSDAQGRFRVRCARGTWTFTVSHPGYLPRAWTVEAEAGEVDVGAVDLLRVPTEPGLHLARPDGFVALPPAPLRRTIVEGKEHRFCVARDAAVPVEVPAGRVRLLDNHVAEWRVYALDAEGCAYRMAKGAGDHWSWKAHRIEPAGEEALAEGRAWIDLDLPPGDYAIAEWYAGFFVRADVPTDTWRASWVRATGPAEAPASPAPAPAAATPVPAPAAPGAP